MIIDDNKKFHEDVMQVRAILNVSQKKLAELIGVTTLTVSRWEREKNCPTRKDKLRFYNYCKSAGIILPGENK